MCWDVITGRSERAIKGGEGKGRREREDAKKDAGGAGQPGAKTAEGGEKVRQGREKERETEEEQRGSLFLCLCAKSFQGFAGNTGNAGVQDAGDAGDAW